MLLGRDVEIDVIRSALEAAQKGESKVVVISGEAGIGKSALLAQAREQSQGLVLSTVGIERESELGYAHLAELFRPVYPALKRIPARQAEALSSVFAIGPTTAVDRFTVSAATLSLFGALANDGPVTILVDDAQWVDDDSMEILSFVAHRLQAEGILMLFAVRSGLPSRLRHGRFPELTVQGLDERSARELITNAPTAPIRSETVNRLVTESAGNPLALLELPKLLSAHELAVWSRGQDPLPIDEVLEEAFCGSVLDLPAKSRQAVILLAVLGRAPLPLLDAALSTAGIDIDDFDPAQQAGLIVARGRELEFRHPLARSAVFQTAPLDQRRRAHLCVADVLTESSLPNALELRAWHVVAAGGGSDEELAALLEEAAVTEFEGANFGSAGRLFERSAELTAGGGKVAERFARAAKCIRLTGAIGESYVMLKRSLSLSGDPALTVALRYSMCRIEMWRSPTRAGRDELLRLADRRADDDPVQAVAMLTDAALASIEIGDLGGARSITEKALTHPDSSSTPPLSLVAVRALVLGLGGEAPEVRALLGSRTAEIDAIDPLATDVADQLTLVVALAHLAAEDVDRARLVLEAGVNGARDRSAIGVLPFRLGRLAWVQFWEGRWSAARASAHEALQLAEDTGWTNERPSSLATLARIEAVTGRAEDCRRHVAESIEAGEEIGGRPYVAYAHAASGLLELTLENYPAAVDQFTVMANLAAQAGFADTPVLWWSGDLIESCLKSGQRERAAAVLDQLEAACERSQIPTALAVAARSRALLDPDRFDHHISAALKHHQRGSMPFERARTQLCLGGALRRRRQRAEARQHLHAALETFERLEAVDWAERTRVELRATGERLAPASAGLAQLTPQELQVALAVARGLSNREVAGQLFLSVKTVEFHLAHVFDKLGLRRRTQLAALVVRSEVADSSAG